MGKALLAYANSKVVHQVAYGRLQSYTKCTITDLARLLRVLASVRIAGAAVSQQEYAIGRFDVAVPVFCRGNVVAAAIELGLRRPGDVGLVQPALAMAARALSHELRTDDVPYAMMVGVERQLEMMLRCAFLTGLLDRCDLRRAV
jgi:DNA-binding IclR family transcriptional regulator